MLTDDDLTRELGEAFRTSTSDLSYAGRTRPPRQLGAVFPAAVAATALGAITIGAVKASDHPRPGVVPKAVRMSTALPRPAVSKVRKPVRVTRTLKLAGFTMTFHSTAGAPDPVVAEVFTGGLPSGVTPVPLTGTQAQAWSGKDPAAGDNALYVKVPTNTGSRLFALLSPTWSQQQLIELFKSPPTAVPEVSGDAGSAG